MDNPSKEDIELIMAAVHDLLRAAQENAIFQGVAATAITSLNERLLELEKQGSTKH